MFVRFGSYLFYILLYIYTKILCTCACVLLKKLQWVWHSLHVCVFAAVNRASTYHSLLEMEKMFPCGSVSIRHFTWRQPGGRKDEDEARGEWDTADKGHSGVGNGGQRERGSTSSIRHHATKSRLEPGEMKKVEALKKSQMWNSEGENNNIFAGGDQGEEWGQKYVGLLHKAGITHRSVNQTQHNRQKASGSRGKNK